MDDRNRLRRPAAAIALVAAALASGCARSGAGAAPSPPSATTQVAWATSTAPTAPASAQPPTSAPSTASASSAHVIRPRIVWRPIPFPLKRKQETAAYAGRHYGIERWQLVHPHVIVEHYTAGTSFASAWSTFAADAPDPELHELPGTCAHFVIDTDGTIYQLVPLGVMCRHTVGLNWTAIGIEHVGTSDQEILHNPRQLRSSLLLTAWLMHRFGISIGDVIGHNESLESPYHRELDPAWRCQTHGDWTHADMQVYRSLLRVRLRREGIPPGTPYHPVSSAC